MGKKVIHAVLFNNERRPFSVLGQEISASDYIEVSKKEFEERDVQEAIRKGRLRSKLVPQPEPDEEKKPASAKPKAAAKAKSAKSTKSETDADDESTDKDSE